MGNSSGSYHSTRENLYRAYDKLPPAARKALQDAAFDWAPQPIMTAWKKGRKGFVTGKDIANSVRVWDASHIKKDRMKVWGIDDKGEVHSIMNVGKKRA